MTQPAPYHERIVELVGKLNPRYLEDLLKLQGYAQLAEATFVPEEHRELVAGAFLNQVKTLRELADRPQQITWYDFGPTIEVCLRVCEAVRLQPVKVRT